MAKTNSVLTPTINEVASHKRLIEEQIEIDACSQSPLYFLQTYGKIRHQTKGVIPFEPWPHLVEYLECLQKYRFIIVIKPKQIGLTWTMSGANLHLAHFLEGANILTLSKGEPEAEESLGYSKFIHNQLPAFLRIPFGAEQDSLLTFPSMHSRIRALASTENAGVGFGGATRVVLDEFEYHKYDKQNYAELLPAILAGGQMIVQSTADSLKENSLFKELYIAARHADNNFYPIFLPYDVVPGRDEKWLEEQFKTSGLKPYQVVCRYPKNEQDALKVIREIQYFKQEALDELRGNCLTPIRHELSDKFHTVKIYKDRVLGHHYILFDDPSDGREDPHAIIVIDDVSLEEVAESHGKIRAEEVAEIHDVLVRYYWNAFNSNEVNATAGGTVDTKLKDLGTPNRCNRIGADGKLKNDIFNWYSTEPLRKKAWEGLDEAIHFKSIRPYNPEIIDEWERIIQREGDIPQARKGAHDDYTTAWAGALHIRTYKKFGDIGLRIRSFTYRT